MRLAELDVRTLAREAVAQVQDGIGAHKVTLVEFADEVSIKADPRLMRMVLEQLLDNARRYTPPGSCIDVLVQTSGSDSGDHCGGNGPGVPEDVLPHLFQPFYRSDQARLPRRRPGWCLTATASIVALHGGTIKATRSSEGGLRVMVSVPARIAGRPTHALGDGEALRPLLVLPPTLACNTSTARLVHPGSESPQRQEECAAPSPGGAARMVPRPPGENAELLERLVVEALRDHVFWRRNYHPEDGFTIRETDKRQEGYEASVAILTQELLGLLAELKRDVPFFSGRYKGHMIAEQTIASQIGYFATMLYNPNNIAAEISPVTTRLEMEVARTWPG